MLHRVKMFLCGIWHIFNVTERSGIIAWVFVSWMKIFCQTYLCEWDKRKGNVCVWKNIPVHVDLAYGRLFWFFFTRLLSISHSWVLCLPIKYLKETVFIAMCFGRGMESICFKLLRYCFNPAGEHVALPGSHFRVCVCVYVGRHQIVTWCSASWNCQCCGSLQ